MKSIEIRKSHQQKLPPIVLQNRDRLVEMEKNENYEEMKKLKKSKKLKMTDSTDFLPSLRHWRLNEIRLFDKNQVSNALNYNHSHY